MTARVPFASAPSLREIIDAKLREAFTRHAKAEAEAWAAWSPVGIATGRDVLCAATQLHDPAVDGLCRDCGTLVGPDDLVCGHDGSTPYTPNGRLS